MEINVEKEDKDFTIIKNELRRQYDAVLEADNSHDTKASIILGFIILVFIQIILNKDLLNFIKEDIPIKILFFSGIIFLTCSLCIGLKAYFIKTYQRGVSVSGLVEQYRTGEKRDYEKVIYGELYRAYLRNTQISENKAKYIKQMIITFATGILFMLLLNIYFLFAL